jgi:hypothetical protein
VSASNVMLMAIILAAIGRWAHNQTAASAKIVVEAIFAILIITMLDNGKTEPVAKGFAWLFFVAVLLGNNSPLTGLAKATGATATKSGKGVL